VAFREAMSPTAAAAFVAQVESSLEDERWKHLLHEVWGWNFESEFEVLLKMALNHGDPNGVILALDMEFPGFIAQEPRSANPTLRYQALRENVDRLRPIQVGVAVSGPGGNLRGVWCFNLKFDVAVDLHQEKAVSFLRSAGLDFPRHAKEGIEAAALGKKLAASKLVGTHTATPWWLTFSGQYDMGYLLKLLTDNSPLPQSQEAFDVAVSKFCPRHHELRAQLPFGSLDTLARRYSVRRYGRAHTAGSDALLTLELFNSLQPAAASGTESDSSSRSRRSSSWNSWDSDASWSGYPGWDSAPWDAHWDTSRWDASWGLGLSPFGDGANPWQQLSAMQAAVAPQLYLQNAHMNHWAHNAGWAANAAKRSGGFVDPVAAAAARIHMGMMGWRGSPYSSKVLAI
jgi:CCR4-NOT transcription complex subunit 7/8